MSYPWRSTCRRGIPIDPECSPRLSQGGCIQDVSIDDNVQEPEQQPSTTSNLLFGNLQQPYQVYRWVPVHVSAGDGPNSWPGDLLQQGATSLVPDDLSITVSRCFSSSARFQFLSSRSRLSLQLQFRFTHTMPKPDGQSPHHRNHSDLLLFRILRDQSLVHLACMGVVAHVHPAGLTQDFA